jgi:uncharacterized protein YaeQ
MAQGSIVHRFSLDVSDTDRGVYEQLDLRLPQHPSETSQLFVARVLAWALNVEEGIESSGGVCAGDEPALRVMGPDGRLRVWIEVGSPDAARLERAARAADAVRVYCHRDPRPLVQQLASVRAARLDKIELFALPLDLLDGLAQLLERSNTWSVLHTEGELYVTVGARTLSGTVSRLSAPAR